MVVSLTGGQVMLSKVATPVISWPRSSDSASSLDLVSSLWITREMCSLLGWAMVSMYWVVLNLWSHSNNSGFAAITVRTSCQGSLGGSLLASGT